MAKMDHMDRGIGILDKKIEALGQYALQIRFQTPSNQSMGKASLQGKSSTRQERWIANLIMIEEKAK
jgi:hypothetical protein